MRTKLYAICLSALLIVFLSHPARTQTSVERHERKERAHIVYVALGDSTGIGVGARRGGYVQRLAERIRASRRRVRTINLCATGATSGDALRHQAGRVAHHRPTFITLSIGANDLINGVSVEQFARNYEDTIVRLRETVRVPIIVMNIPDLSLAPAVPSYMRESARRHIIRFNGRIAAIAARHELAVIDLYAASAEFARRRERFSADGLHPSDAGYEFWAEAMWPSVRRAFEGRRD